MSITSLGTIYEETLPGGTISISGSATLSLSSLGTLKSTGRIIGSASLALSSSGFLKSTAKLSGSSSFVLTTTGNTVSLYPKFETSKLSDYTIFRRLADHVEIADQNLISQFTGCPNILSLLRVPLNELDQISQDIRDFQDKLVNIEEAEGVNLDLMGAIAGVQRLTNEDDLLYRDRIKTQVVINNCNGTFRNILIALISTYNLPPDSRSQNDIQIRTLTHNRANLYLRNYLHVFDHGGTAFIDSLTAGGARLNVLVNAASTLPGEYFGLDGSTGLGLGSVDDANSGGDMVGTYNRDLNATVLQQFGLEGAPEAFGLNVGAFLSGLVTIDTATPTILDGDLTPTTTSTLGVDTFS